MYERRKQGWEKHLDFIILELISMQISFIFAYVLRHGWKLPYQQMEYMQLSIAIFLLDSCIIFFNDSFNGILRRGYLKEFTASIKHVTVFMAVLLAYLFITKTSSIYSRESLSALWVFQIMLSYIEKIIWKKYLLRRRMRAKERVARSVLLITGSGLVKEIMNHLKTAEYSDFVISSIALLDVDQINDEIAGVEVVASKDNLYEYIKKSVIDEVFINLPANIALPDGMVQQFMDAGITVHLNIARLERGMGKQVVEHFGEYTVLTSSIGMVSRQQLFYKRVMDLCGALVGLVITGVLTVCIAPIIWSQSPGPIFFTQERVGKGGRKFCIYKFRSMYPDAEARKKELMENNAIKDGMMFKMENDPRIFPFGHFIRKYSLDEFPQFWNVLKGEMSLVGTRPPTVDEYEKYELHHLSRLSVKPGITGMWQVSGRSKINCFEDVVELDNCYIQNWSLGLDVKILWQTVKVVFGGDGAM